MTLFVPSGQGPFARGRNGKQTAFKVTGASTGGRFGLFEHYLPPASGGAGPHYHKEMIESFYVLEGEVRFTIGDTVRLATTGDVLYIPQNVTHGFKVSEHNAARLLMMFCPALDREKYFEALEELGENGQPLDQGPRLSSPRASGKCGPRSDRHHIHSDGALGSTRLNDLRFRTPDNRRSEMSPGRLSDASVAHASCCDTLPHLLF